MKIIVPDYYKDFHCIAGACRHSCCIGWEIDVDEDSQRRFSNLPDIAPHVENGHIRLLEGERCLFLNADGLCDMIINHGEDILCGICRDHPRFRNFWADRVEMGLGLVCEEACRLILTRSEPMKLSVLEDDGEDEECPDDEAWLTNLRTRLLLDLPNDPMTARLFEYLVYRHLSDALYDGRVDARIAFIDACMEEITEAWARFDTLDEKLEFVREWSYDVEYDEDELEKRITRFE